MFSRRDLAWVGAAALATTLAAGAQAAEYPTKPVTMLVPYGAGGITDVMARLTARHLEAELGETIVVVNRTGASGTVGLTATARERADGYTIAMVPSAPLIIQPHLRPVGYDLDAFDYICQVFASPIVLTTAQDSPFEDLSDVLDEAKANPDALTYSSAGPGSLPHISMVRLLEDVGAKMRHVPMEGDAGATTAVQGGHVDLAIVGGSSVVGKDLKTITIFDDEPMASVPGAKPARESGHDVTYVLWGGIIAPKGIPDEARTRLTDACEAAASSEDFAAEMREKASNAAFLPPEGFRAAVDADSEANAKVIDALGMARR
ncbi:tripartite tricarboxylate transporter substrate binding protein [Acuticoccus sp.]|uniref:tripartite tricarboxylate transporter substrate binding protein n=1 Tax=Acuticoccus sp. TaxID=1904378 RepID=UPI003B52683C